MSAEPFVCILREVCECGDYDGWEYETCEGCGLPAPPDPAPAPSPAEQAVIDRFGIFDAEREARREAIRQVRDQAWQEGYEACRRGEQRHSPYRFAALDPS